MIIYHQSNLSPDPAKARNSRRPRTWPSWTNLAEFPATHARLTTSTTPGNSRSAFRALGRLGYPVVRRKSSARSPGPSCGQGIPRCFFGAHRNLLENVFESLSLARSLAASPALPRRYGVVLGFALQRPECLGGLGFLVQGQGAFLAPRLMGLRRSDGRPCGGKIFIGDAMFGEWIGLVDFSALVVCSVDTQYPYTLNRSKE